MSKLENQYKQLKLEDSEYIYLIRVGIFYNILNEDAIILNKKIGLQISNLSPNIIRCGFPIAQLDKYKSILDSKNIKYKVIDNLPNNSNVAEYLNNVEIKKILNKIETIDMDNISYHQAYDILLDIQNKLKSTPQL